MAQGRAGCCGWRPVRRSRHPGLWRRHGGRYLGPTDALDFRPPVLLIEHTFARHDSLVRGQAAVELDRLRRGGSTVLLVSHEEDLLRELCDEIWWLDGADWPAAAIRKKFCAATEPDRAATAAWGECSARPPRSPPAPRRRTRRDREPGTARRERPTRRRAAQRRVGSRARDGAFRDAVADPVIGIMIRTAHRTERLRHEHRTGRA